MQYRLCESYRFDNSVRHQTVVHLGILEELPDPEQKKALAKRIDELVKTAEMLQSVCLNLLMKL